MADKYITFAARKESLDYCSFVRFNEHLVHADMAHMMIPMIALSYSCCMTDVHVLGAGFVVNELMGPTCFGESDSLKVHSRGEDDQIIMRWHGSTYITDAPDAIEGV